MVQALRCVKLGDVLVDENRRAFLLCSICWREFAELKDLQQHLKTCPRVRPLFEEARQIAFPAKGGETLLCSSPKVDIKKELRIFKFTEVKSVECVAKDDGVDLTAIKIEEEEFIAAPANAEETTVVAGASRQLEYHELLEAVTPYVQFKETPPVEQKKVEQKKPPLVQRRSQKIPPLSGIQTRKSSLAKARETSEFTVGDKKWLLKKPPTVGNHKSLPTRPQRGPPVRPLLKEKTPPKYPPLPVAHKRSPKTNSDRSKPAVATKDPPAVAKKGSCLTPRDPPALPSEKKNKQSVVKKEKTLPTRRAKTPPPVVEEQQQAATKLVKRATASLGRPANAVSTRARVNQGKPAAREAKSLPGPAEGVEPTTKGTEVAITFRKIVPPASESVAVEEDLRKIEAPREEATPQATISGKHSEVREVPPTVETEKILNKLQNLGLEVKRSHPPAAVGATTAAGETKTTEILELLKRLQSKNLNVKIVNKSEDSTEAPDAKRPRLNASPGHVSIRSNTSIMREISIKKTKQKPT